LGLIWLILGVVGVLVRMAQLFVIKDVQAGLGWGTKILTDPFHDIKLYHKAPGFLLRGELIDPTIASEHAPLGPGRRLFASPPGGGGGTEPAPKAMLKHLFQNLALDAGARLLRSIPLPPPAVAAHGLGGSNKAVGDGVKVGGRIVEAEDQAAGAHPAERQSLAAQ